jgi:hypothetical protein
MRSWIILGVWVLLILFPLAWLGSVNPSTRNFINWLLSPEWLHWVAHTVIFAVLVILILIQQRRQGNEVSLAALITIILVIGGTQELLQFLTSEYRSAPMIELGKSSLDLMIDLAGGMLGLGIYTKVFDRSQREWDPYNGEN